MRAFAELAALSCLAGLASGAAAQSIDRTSSAELASLWISACLDGRLEMAPDRVREVGDEGFDSYWRDKSNERNPHFYRILKPAKASLYITDHDPATAEGFKSSCQLTTRSRFDLGAMWPVVGRAIGTPNPRHVTDMDMYTVDNPAEGYKILIRPWILSVGHYTDKIVRKARAQHKKPTVEAENTLAQ